jgi:uncharacterized protein YeeX (DUF496 family)
MRILFYISFFDNKNRLKLLSNLSFFISIQLNSKIILNIKQIKGELRSKKNRVSFKNLSFIRE